MVAPRVGGPTDEAVSVPTRWLCTYPLTSSRLGHISQDSLHGKAVTCNFGGLGLELTIKGKEDRLCVPVLEGKKCSGKDSGWSCVEHIFILRPKG